MGIELTDDEIVILHDVFDGYGCDCPGGDTDKIQSLAEKLGIWKPIEPPTEEELRLREEFKNTPFGKQMAELFSRTNEYVAKSLLEYQKDVLFTTGPQWPAEFAKDGKIGTTLRIRLPNDFVIDENTKFTVGKQNEEKS